MRRKPNQVNTRVGDRIDNAIEEFAEDHNFSKAEAVREIFENQLATEGYLDRQVAVTDGGLAEDIDTIKSELEQLDNTDSTEDIENELQRLGLLLALVILYVALQPLLPIAASIAIGVAVAVGTVSYTLGWWP